MLQIAVVDHFKQRLGPSGDSGSTRSDDLAVKHIHRKVRVPTAYDPLGSGILNTGTCMQISTVIHIIASPTSDPIIARSLEKRRDFPGDW